MPPLLALCICTVFVLFMLRLDRKQSPEVSFALWIPTFWILLTFSKPLSIWFQSGGATIEEGSPLDRVFLTALVFLGIIIFMNWGDHPLPHFHARYGEHEAVIRINDLVLTEGQLPPRVLGLVVE